MKVLIDTFLYKECGLNVYKYVFTRSIYITYTLYKPRIHRRSKGEKGAMALPNF